MEVNSKLICQWDSAKLYIARIVEKKRGKDKQGGVREDNIFLFRYQRELWSTPNTFRRFETTVSWFAILNTDG